MSALRRSAPRRSVSSKEDSRRSVQPSFAPRRFASARGVRPARRRRRAGRGSRRRWSCDHSTIAEPGTDRAPSGVADLADREPGGQPGFLQGGDGGAPVELSGRTISAAFRDAHHSMSFRLVFGGVARIAVSSPPSRPRIVPGRVNTPSAGRGTGARGGRSRAASAGCSGGNSVRQEHCSLRTGSPRCCSHSSEPHSGRLRARRESNPRPSA
jgi:hypothetical protein